MANITRPSALAVQDPNKLVAFSFWFWIEHRVSAFYASLCNTCDDIRDSIMNFVLANAASLFFMYNFVPWRLIGSFYRYMTRPTRYRAAPKA